MVVQRVGKLRFSLGHYIAVLIGICVASFPIGRSYPTVVRQLDIVTSTASVLATVRVEQTSRGDSLGRSRSEPKDLSFRLSLRTKVTS